MMVTFDFVNGLRGFIIIVTIFVLFMFTTRYIRAFKKLSRSQKLYIGSFILALITLTWDTWNYMWRDEEFSLRLVPYSVMLTLCFVYLLEPFSVARKRFGNEPYDPMDKDSFNTPIERDCALENEELRNKLYELSRRENSLTIENMMLKTEVNTLKEGRVS